MGFGIGCCRNRIRHDDFKIFSAQKLLALFLPYIKRSQQSILSLNLCNIGITFFFENHDLIKRKQGLLIGLNGLKESFCLRLGFLGAEPVHFKATLAIGGFDANIAALEQPGFEGFDGLDQHR